MPEIHGRPDGVDQERLLRRLRQVEALREGHFLLTSGRHSPVFVQCSRILQFPDDASWLATALGEMFRGEAVSVVVGPAMGGVILAHEVARVLGARSAFTEKQTGTQVFRRGFRLSPEDRALMVEDVLTTGGSVLASAEAVRATGATLVGVGLIIDRTGWQASATLGLGERVPVRALASFDAPSYPPGECPLCEDGLPLESPKD